MYIIHCFRYVLSQNSKQRRRRKEANKIIVMRKWHEMWSNGIVARFPCETSLPLFSSLFCFHNFLSFASTLYFPPLLFVCFCSASRCHMSIHYIVFCLLFLWRQEQTSWFNYVFIRSLSLCVNRTSNSSRGRKTHKNQIKIDNVLAAVGVFILPSFR